MIVALALMVAALVALFGPSPGWEELVELALIEVRWYRAGTPQVARRLTALLERVAGAVAPRARPRSRSPS